MSEVPLPIRLAQTIGITVASAAAGSTLSISFYTIPRLLESPTPLILKQWGHLFDTGRKTGPPIGMTAAASFFYLAYALKEDRFKFLGYLVAGGLSVGIVPYTLLVLMGTNRKLLSKVEETRALGKGESMVEVGLGKETAHRLVDWWGVLNVGRGLILAAAGVVGAWTTLA
jgi:hypothetical protein